MNAGDSKQVQGLLLDEHARWKFWRFDMSTSLGDSPRRVEYALDAEGLDKTARCSHLLAETSITLQQVLCYPAKASLITLKGVQKHGTGAAIAKEEFISW